MRIRATNRLARWAMAVGVGIALAAGMTVWRYVGASHIADRARARAETPGGVTVFDNWDQFYVLAPCLRA